MSDIRPSYRPRSEELTRARGTGDIEGVQKKVWRAIRAAEEIMYDEGASAHQVLKAVTAIQQAARTYVKLIEYVELEERLRSLEYAAFGLHGDEVAANGEESKHAEN